MTTSYRNIWAILITILKTDINNFIIIIVIHQIIYCYKYFVCYPWVYGVTEGVSSVHPVGNPINHSIQFGVISDGLKPALEIHAVR